MVGSVDPFTGSASWGSVPRILTGYWTALWVHLDNDARHSLRVSADQRDLLIGHRFRFLAEQFATARDRDRLRDVLRTFDELHGHSCELDGQRSSWRGVRSSAPT